jgi:hypothetical protein
MLGTSGFVQLKLTTAGLPRRAAARRASDAGYFSLRESSFAKATEDKSCGKTGDARISFFSCFFLPDQ